MVSVSRRNFGVILGGLLGTAALAACTSTKDSNGNTVVSISVAKIDAYAQAIVNGADSLLGSATVVKILGASNVALVKKYATDVSTFLAQFDAATKGVTVITWNDKTAVSVAQSILTTAQNLLAVIQDTISAAQLADIPSSVSDIVSAIRTVVSLLQALLTVTLGASAQQVKAVITPTMTEEQALHILHVAVPE